jgi:hypothetical protein
MCTSEEWYSTICLVPFENLCNKIIEDNYAAYLLFTRRPLRRLELLPL